MEDISYRAIRSISKSQIVLCEDTRVSKKLFTLLEQKLQIDLNISSKRFFTLHLHNEKDFLQNCDIDFTKQVIYISDAGAPCISDPGALLVQYCIKNDIAYDFIGGASAFISAYVMSGFLDNSFLFYGFLPNKGKARVEKLKELMQQTSSVILYEAPHRIINLVQEIANIQDDREIFLIKEITKLHQKSIKAKASDVIAYFNDVSTKGEWVVVISKNETLSKQEHITLEDIQALSLKPKEKAKLIAKLTNQNIKVCYEKLLNK